MHILQEDQKLQALNPTYILLNTLNLGIFKPLTLVLSDFFN